MPSVTIQLTGTCPGGEHLRFTITGAISRTVDLTASQLQQAIDDARAVDLIAGICRFAKQGRTLAQTRTLLQNGVTVTV